MIPRIKNRILHFRCEEIQREQKQGVSLQRQVVNEFHRALHQAQKSVSKGNPELAIEWCRNAATLAWGGNTGFFYSHELEQLLVETGRRYVGSVSTRPSTPRPPKRFLHVMSAAYEIGGHTRVVSRWIGTCARLAPSEHHSILVSRQNGAPLPEWLGRSVEKAGGEVIQLPPGLPWLQAAREIRSRSTEFDAVVLHIHPNDPLPNLALHDRAKPVLFYRHSDHVFNLGYDVASVIADFRPVGHEISQRFSALQPRKVLLPLPLLEEELVSCEKTYARKKLGLPVDAQIVLTIGSAYKFRPRFGYSFPAMARSLLEKSPHAFIVAVGITESDPFPGLRQSLNGRIAMTGFVHDREVLETYWQSADVYLDGFPCTSVNAALEAAHHGLPVQRFYNPYQRLMWCDDPGLDSVVRGASTQDEYVAGVAEWLRWPAEKRAELGCRFRRAVLQDHCGASWRSRWLDPAIDVLISTRNNDLAASKHNCFKKNEAEFPGLGETGSDSDWPAGMFVAGAVLSMDHPPFSIRMSGLLHSIRPAIFCGACDGDRGKRILMLGLLMTSFLPSRIRTPLRWMWRAYFAKA